VDFGIIVGNKYFLSNSEYYHLMDESKSSEVSRNNNQIKIHSLNHPKVVSSFLFEIKKGMKLGFKEFTLDFSDINTVFPNAATPLCGTIEYFKKQGILFKTINNIEVIDSIYLLNPIVLVNQEQVFNKNIFNKIWQFSNSASVFWLVSAFLDELSKTDEFETGVLQGIEWCINEVMDNVIQHSKENVGFVMGQIHKSNKHVAFTVFDYGQGIYNSLKNSIHSPRHPVDAITLCIKEGITRDKKIGQGNGMFGLHQIIKFNKGSLSITSTSASYFLQNDISRTFLHIPSISREKGSTTVDFQLDYSNEVSIGNALKFNDKHYDHINIRVENLENDYGQISYILKDRASGYGTRQSGSRTRNEILNLYKESKKVINIDFDGISVITSSFADELIGKLVIEFGFYGFNNIVRLKNMNTLIQGILHKSVSQRMAESLKK
jgi:hypothetical protein